MAFKVLVADDKIYDQKDSISELPALLRGAGYDVVITDDGAAVYDLVWEHSPDLIVLDINFNDPEVNGIEICRSIRLEGSQVPVILVTEVFTETEDVLRGFEAGADDYVIRPRDNREILARVRANLSPGVVEIEGRLCIDFAGHRVWVCRDGKWQEVHLPPLEFALLHVLVMNAGLLLPSTVLKDRVWGKDVSDSALAVYIRRLREKLEPSSDHPLFIETIPGLGYRFNGRPSPGRLPDSTGGMIQK
jgi:two-component system response regulator MtrA